MSDSFPKVRIGFPSPKLEMVSQLSPKAKAFGCALTIILGIGGLAVAGFGLGGYLGSSFSQLNQVQSMVMMITGTSGGIVFLTGGIIAAVKNCQKKKVTSKNIENEKDKSISTVLCKKGKGFQPFSRWLVPNEILSLIFSFLDDFSLVSCGMVCKHWRNLDTKLIKCAIRSSHFKKCADKFKKAAEKGQLRWILKDKDFFIKNNVKSVISITCAEKWIFSGSVDAKINVWNFEDLEWKCIDTLFEHTDIICSLLFEGKRLFSGSWDNTIKVWNLEDEKWKCIKTLSGHRGKVSCLCTSGERLFSGSWDNTIKVWNLESPELECIQTISVNGNGITSLFYADTKLFSGDINGVICIWELNPQNKKWEQIDLLDLNRRKIGVISLYFADEMLFVGCSEGLLLIFEKNTQKNDWEQFGATKGHSRSIYYENGILITGGADETIRVWKLNKEDKKLENTQVIELPGKNGCSKDSVSQLFYEKKGRLLTAADKGIYILGPEK